MSDMANADDRYGVDIGKYLGILKRQKGFVIVFVLSAVLSSLALTYITSEKYEAATTIFYRPIEMSMLRAKETESFGAPVPTPPFKVIMQTLRDAVRNESVLRPVVVELELDKTIEPEYSSWYKRWYGQIKNFAKGLSRDSWTFLKYGRLIDEDPTYEAIRGLRRNINIVATKDSYIYILKVKDKYPDRAARIVDVAGKKLVEWLKTEQQNPSYKRLHELQKQLINQENKIKALRAQRENLLNENAFVSIAEETTKGVNNLYGLELEDVRISAQIEKKEKEVSEYDNKIQAGSKGSVQSDDFKSMVSKRLFGEIDMKGLIAERDFIKSSIRSQKDRLQNLPALQNKLDDLDMRIDAATNEYRHLKDFYTEVSTEVATSPGETRVLHSAIGSHRPVQPIKIYHMGLTVFLGLMLSIGMVYVLDFLNIRTFFSSKGDSSAGSGGSTGTFFVSKKSSFLLEELVRNITARGGSLFLRSEDSLVLAGSLDPGHVPSSISLPLKKGSVFEQVMAKGESVLIQDIGQESDILSSGWDGYRDSSSLAFPLADKDGSIIGLVSLHNKISPPFTQQDKELGSLLLRYHMSDLETKNRLSEPDEESADFEGQKGRKTGWNRLCSILRPVVITTCGIILALLVFFLLRKVGY